MINNFWPAGDKFKPDMHLRKSAALDKPRFSYSASG